MIFKTNTFIDKKTMMIKSIFEFIADNPKYYGICINKLTCFHDEELSSISNVKKQINNIISAD